MEDTTLETELHTRYCNLVFIGLPSLKMHVSLSFLVMNVKELGMLVDVRIGLDQKLEARALNEHSVVRLVKLVARFLMNRAKH